MGQVSAIKDLFDSMKFEADRSHKQAGDPKGDYEKAFEAAKLCFCIAYKDDLTKLNDLRQCKDPKRPKLYKILKDEDKAKPASLSESPSTSGSSSSFSSSSFSGSSTTSAFTASASPASLVSGTISSITNQSSSKTSGHEEERPAYTPTDVEILDTLPNQLHGGK